MSGEGKNQPATLDTPAILDEQLPLDRHEQGITEAQDLDRTRDRTIAQRQQP